MAIPRGKGPRTDPRRMTQRRHARVLPLPAKVQPPFPAQHQLVVHQIVGGNSFHSPLFSGPKFAAQDCDRASRIFRQQLFWSACSALGWRAGGPMDFNDDIYAPLGGRKTIVPGMTRLRFCGLICVIVVRPRSTELCSKDRPRNAAHVAGNRERKMRGLRRAEVKELPFSAGQILWPWRRPRPAS